MSEMQAALDSSNADRTLQGLEWEAHNTQHDARPDTTNLLLHAVLLLSQGSGSLLLFLLTVRLMLGGAFSACGKIDGGGIRTGRPL